MRLDRPGAQRRGSRRLRRGYLRLRACLRIASTWEAKAAGAMIGVPRHGDIDSRSDLQELLDRRGNLGRLGAKLRAAAARLVSSVAGQPGAGSARCRVSSAASCAREDRPSFTNTCPI
jgi:hypothetical protein